MARLRTLMQQHGLADVVRAVVKDGPRGPVGPAGAASNVPGPTGPAGSNGADGAPGATGPTGPAGSNGATGAAGPTGAVGATGPAGVSGVAGMVANVSATNTTANQTLVSYTVPSWTAGDQYDFEAFIYHNRGSTGGSANAVVELLVAGVVVRTITRTITTTTNTSRAGHYHGHVRCITTGASGTAQHGLQAMADFAGTANSPTRTLDPDPNAPAGSPASTTLDTTGPVAIELRMRMSAAVTGLNIFCTRATIRRGV